VLGHTADVGPGDGSELSQRRADAVADVLLAALAGLPLTVEAKGLGESQPVAPNDTEENRSRNRRVEIVYAAT
jgi:outer membrane protein OmpA-like peptidoglycan-associated protein